MTDESFHLTPLDIRRYDFGARAFRGYDENKVEDFRNQVAEELERLTRANQELESKARGFHEQLRAFRERDKALNDALVSAQQLRSEIREQAEREAQLILREARAQSEQLVAEARAEIRRRLVESEAAHSLTSDSSHAGVLTGWRGSTASFSPLLRSGGAGRLEAFNSASCRSTSARSWPM
jgi:DivIVA domain-containing protein